MRVRETKNGRDMYIGTISRWHARLWILIADCFCPCCWFVGCGNCAVSKVNITWIKMTLFLACKPINIFTDLIYLFYWNFAPYSRIFQLYNWGMIMVGKSATICRSLTNLPMYGRRGSLMEPRRPVWFVELGYMDISKHEDLSPNWQVKWQNVWKCGKSKYDGVIIPNT